MFVEVNSCTALTARPCECHFFVALPLKIYMQKPLIFYTFVIIIIYILHKIFTNMGKTIIKRDANLKFADEANVDSFYVANDKENKKDYILTQTDQDGNFQWIDLGSRANLSNYTFDSFQEALDYAMDQPNIRVTEHETRMGALTTLLENTKNALKTDYSVQS